jgi:hypothetical protein
MTARTLEAALGSRQRRLLAGLDSPAKIQGFLDSIPYSTDKFYRCPLRVLRDRKAHCFDGAVFAAASLRRLGYPPRIVDMHAERDDDHMLAVYREGGLWGAVAKSNFVGLRYREPVYRSLRELVMSYFEVFFNLDREKTLRAYTIPLDLRTYDRLGWEVADEPMEIIAQRTDTIRRTRVVTPEMVQDLCLVDRRSYQAGLMGADAAGLYRPATSRSA